MGWSYASAAGKMFDKMTAKCIESTGSQNTWTEKGGTKYFWEASRTEHVDGSITGTIYKFVDESHIVKSGSFKIDGDGEMIRGPKFLKEA